MPKLDTDSTRKEHNRFISLTFIVVKIQNKILASQTQQCVSSQGTQEGFKCGQFASLQDRKTGHNFSSAGKELFH